MDAGEVHAHLRAAGGDEGAARASLLAARKVLDEIARVSLDEMRAQEAKEAANEAAREAEMLRARIVEMEAAMLDMRGEVDALSAPAYIQILRKLEPTPRPL
mmetsp:Transcript_5803/g.19724  ORF Transcript_5803/g.19724 Transcript_5803/m.19724 type:complete len:102 (-) Transcript_5803:223-528(-)